MVDDYDRAFRSSVLLSEGRKAAHCFDCVNEQYLKVSIEHINIYHAVCLH